MNQLSDAQNEFLQRLSYFYYYMAYLGLPIKFHSYYRGGEEQNRLFAEKKTKARAGESSHNYGLAVDYHFQDGGWNVPKSYWQRGDMVARWVGLESGLGYDDANHIQLPGWKRWKSTYSY